MEYMEHSNFYAMCDKIRKMEARELHLALESSWWRICLD